MRFKYWIIGGGLLGSFLFSTGFVQAAGVVRNSDFIVSAPTEQLAKDFLAELTKQRESLALRYLGILLPTSVGPTIVHVQMNSADGEDSHLTQPIDDPKRNFHSQWFRFKDNDNENENMAEKFCDSIAHETLHCIFGTQYPHIIPALNEGLASRHDDLKLQKVRIDILRYLARFPYNIPRLRKLITKKSIAGPDQATYALSQMLVHVLMTKIDRSMRPINPQHKAEIEENFTDLDNKKIPLTPERLIVLFSNKASEEEKDSFEKALQYYYGMTFDELEKEWYDRIRKGGITLEKVDNTKP